MNQIPSDAASEQPAATIDPATDTSAQPQGDPTPAAEFADHAAIFAALEAAERGEVYQPQPDVEEAPPAEVVAPVVEQTPATETIVPDKAPQRISVRALPAEQQRQLAQAVELVRNGQAADITAAILQITGDEFAPEALATAPDVPAAASAPVVPDDVTAINTRLDELREQRKQAIKDYDADAQADLTTAIEKAQLELLRAEQSATTRTAEVQSYQQAYDTAVDELETKHPQSTDETTPFYQILADKVDAAKARRDPALADPRFILRFADDVAAMLGTATPQAKPTPAAPAPARASRPVGSALAPGQASAARVSTDELSDLVRTLPLGEAEKLIFTF